MYGSLMIDLAGTTLTQEDIELLKAPEVGGIILFARNIETPSQVRELCESIRHVKRSVSQEIIIGVDQEGGRVARLRQGFSPLPAMGKLGTLFNSNPAQALSLAYDSGYLMASEVMAVGIDVSFAPVLDVDGVSQVIGDRSFHTHTDAIVALSSQFMLGMKKAGMATTGKHFPGHGSVAPDSHVADAVDDRSFDQIMAVDLQPFIKTIPLLDALMPAHVIFSQVDSKPAGFSKIWLQDICRQQLGFGGVLFSDDLSMMAAKVAGDIKDRVTAALQAGCDIALVCNDREAAMQAVAQASHLPKPEQHRIENMRGLLPSWENDLTTTCAQFDYWQTARDNVTGAFFNENTAIHIATDQKNTTDKHDPTEYTS